MEITSCTEYDKRLSLNENVIKGVYNRGVTLERNPPKADFDLMRRVRVWDRVRVKNIALWLGLVGLKVKAKSWIRIAHRRETTSNALPFSRKSALISASQSDSQASANTARPRDMGWCTTRYACLLPSCRWYQIILLGDRGSRV